MLPLLSCSCLAGFVWEVGPVGSCKCVWAGGKLLCVLILIPHSAGGKGPGKVAGSRGASVLGTWSRLRENDGRKEEGRVREAVSLLI